MNRENAGYTITDSVRVGRYEIVIGEMLSAPGCYVCWYCRGGNDYFWGKYCSTRAAALRFLCERVDYELRASEQRGDNV